MLLMLKKSATICALSTAPGSGAIAVIRVSGPASVAVVNGVFSKEISNAGGYTAHYGQIQREGVIIDDVVLTVFRSPQSFTGEDSVEIACHGSKYIQQQLLQLLYEHGCDPATPGEFTKRAFLNGKMDLSQAEAVADLIASESAAAHRLAMYQMKGGFSGEIGKLRDQLIHFASMIELELDFSEEDVEFADRTQLRTLVVGIRSIVTRLVDSFAFGNVIRNGIPVAIVGVPNVGKSTLLNALLNEEKAIVSEIAGTTRDSIEDVMMINGVEFRFIDTAGLRETNDIVENIGIERTWKKVNEADILLYLVDAVDSSSEEIEKVVKGFREKVGNESKKLIVVANKTDKTPDTGNLSNKFGSIPEVIFISAKQGTNIDMLKEALFSYVSSNSFFGQDTVVTNARHHAALQRAQLALQEVEQGMDAGLTGDLLAEHLRMALFHLGEITGQINTEDLLGNIFSKFCIGK